MSRAPKFTDTIRFRSPYAGVAETAKPNYLARKWDRAHPGWRKRQKPAVPVEIVQIKRKATR